MPETKDAGITVPVVTTAQAAYDASDKAKAIRLTLKAGINGALAMGAGTGDVVIEARSGETATITAPITGSKRRVVIDGSKGRVITNGERVVTGTEPTTGQPIYAVGPVKEAVKYSGPEFVLIGKGSQLDIHGNPGVTRAYYVGELSLSSDVLRRKLDEESVTICVQVPDAASSRLPEYREYPYREAEA